MQHQEVHIPSFMRSFLGDVNIYYEALPETFQSELKS